MVEFWFPCWIMFVTQEVLSSTYKCFLLASMCEFFPFSIDLLNVNVGCTKSSFDGAYNKRFCHQHFPLSRYQEERKKKTCVLIGATNGVNSSSLASAPCLQWGHLLPVDTFLFNDPKANRNGRLKLLYVLLHCGYTLH